MSILLVVEVTEEEEMRLREYYTPVYDLPSAEALGRMASEVVHRDWGAIGNQRYPLIGEAILAEIRRKP